MNLRELGRLLATAAGATVATFAVALLGHALSPSLGASIAVVVALFVVLVELGRLRAGVERRLEEVEADVAQMEPLLMLGSRLRPRRPLPPMRGYAIAPDFALMLTNLVADERPELVVETGSGVSTLVIAYALEKLGRGQVVALEHDAGYADKTRAEIERHGLSRYAKVVHAPLEPLEVSGEHHVWYARSALDGLKNVDLVVDDGPPKYLGKMLRYASLPMFIKRLSPRGLFVLDAIGEEEPKVIARWKANYPHMSFEQLATKKGNLVARVR
jgi:predicted O-methyltransferase YrrM